MTLATRRRVPWLRRPLFSWTRIKGESDVQGGWENGSVEEREGTWIGTDGGSPEGDWSPCRRRGRGWSPGPGAAVERGPEAGGRAAAAAGRVVGRVVAGGWSRDLSPGGLEGASPGGSRAWAEGSDRRAGDGIGSRAPRHGGAPPWRTTRRATTPRCSRGRPARSSTRSIRCASSWTSARHRIRHGIRHTAARAGRRPCPCVANGPVGPKRRHMFIFLR